MEPLATQSNERAAFNRLKITVQADFINTKDKKQNYNSSFNFYADFPQNQSLSAVEDNLIKTIADQVVLDIFNKSVANW